MPQGRGRSLLLALTALRAGAQSEVDVQSGSGKNFPPPHLFAKQHVPPHSKFVWSQGDGTFELESNRSLRLAMLGKGQKRWMELKAARPGINEKFSVANGFIKLEANPTLCVGVSMIEADAPIHMQQCQQDGDGAADSQGFLFSLDGRVKHRKSGMCVNIKGGFKSANVGSELVLGPCGDDGVFVKINKKIAVKSRTDLHFNVKGGAADAPVILWKSPAAAEESFEFTEAGQLTLKDKKAVCVHVQGGVGQGRQVIGWPCKKEAEITEEQQFGYDPNRFVVHSLANDSLVFNIQGGVMTPGIPVVMWPWRDPRTERRKPEL